MSCDIVPIMFVALCCHQLLLTLTFSCWFMLGFFGEEIPELVYQVKAVLINCRKSKGYRSSIYRCAQDCFAYYSKEGSIYYDRDSQDLDICLWFKKEEHALQFQNALSKFAGEHARFKEKLVLNKNLEIIREQRNQPQRVMGDDYDPAANNDSPDMSLNDVLSDGCSQISNICHDPAYALQSLESVTVVSKVNSKWYKCHLISRTDKELSNNKDNVIYESWTFHQLFDGLNTVDGVGVLVSFVRFADPLEEEVMVADGKYEKRQKLIVRVTFKDRDIARVMGVYLKEGTVQRDDCSYESFLYARDAQVMRRCLNVKYEAGKDSFYDEPSSMAVVEAEPAALLAPPISKKMRADKGTASGSSSA